MKLSCVNYYRDLNFLGVLDCVFSATLTVRRNKGMDNVTVFGNLTVAGVKSFGKDMTGASFGR